MDTSFFLPHNSGCHVSLYCLSWSREEKICELKDRSVPKVRVGSKFSGLLGTPGMSHCFSGTPSECNQFIAFLIFLLHCILKTSLLSIEVSDNLIMISCYGIEVVLDTQSYYIEKIKKEWTGFSHS